MRAWHTFQRTLVIFCKCSTSAIYAKQNQHTEISVPLCGQYSLLFWKVFLGSPALPQPPRLLIQPLAYWSTQKEVLWLSCVFGDHHVSLLNTYLAFLSRKNANTQKCWNKSQTLWAILEKNCILNFALNRKVAIFSALIFTDLVNPVKQNFGKLLERRRIQSIWPP